MAYMNQEMKAKLSPKIKEVLKKWGLSGTLSVDGKTELVLSIKSGKLDFQSLCATKFMGVEKSGGLIGAINVYWIKDHWLGEAKDALLELKAAMNEGNWDRSDSQSDYFDVGWYVDIRFGSGDKPYELIR